MQEHLHKEGFDHGTSSDNPNIGVSSSLTDWRAKYMEVADMLAETRGELDDFHHASKELEAELENELQRTEKAQEVLKVKVARAEAEREDWKNKFMTLQTVHNTGTTSLQKELDMLRQEYQRLKIQLRDLELGNDDLERNERAVSSSLADMEAKYSRALEEKILLEHELLGKASLEEESQRLRDELRDAMVEISILKAQVDQSSKSSDHVESDLFPCLSPVVRPASENHKPTDFLVDATSSNDQHSVTANDKSQTSDDQTVRGHTPLHSNGRMTLGIRPETLRSGTLPSIIRSTPTSRIADLPPPSKYHSTAPRAPHNAPKNKGVQMVSEMRARVRNLEQKIHTRVPRLRMGSLTSKNVNMMASSTCTGVSAASSSSSSSSRASTAKTSWESLVQRHSVESGRSPGSSLETRVMDSAADSSGWVLILEDSPTHSKETRRISANLRDQPNEASQTASNSIPSPTISYRPESFRSNIASPGIRRPQSRLSAGNLSTTASTIRPTRPVTPTHLPLPCSPTSYTTGGIPSLKRRCIPHTSNPLYSNYWSESTAPSSKHRTIDCNPLTKLPEPLPKPSRPSSTSRLPGSTATATSTAVSNHTRIGRPMLSGRKSVENSNIAVKSFV